MITLIIDPRDPEVLRPLKADGSRALSVTASIRPSRDGVRLASGGFLTSALPARESSTTDSPISFVVPATDDVDILAADRSTFEYVVDVEFGVGGRGRGRGESRTVTFRGMLPASLGVTAQVTAMLPEPGGPLTPTQYGDLNARLSGVESATSTSTLDGRYAPVSTASTVAGMQDGTVSLPYVPTATLALPSPFYLSHRGSGFAPENTMAGFRASLASGADGLEMDLQPLADGSLALLHDATVDRTTDGTGPATDYTAPTWAALNAAAKFPWNGKVEPPATLAQVLGEFGGQTVLMIEPKSSGDANLLMDALDKRKLAANTILATSTLSVMATMKARGYKVYFWWGSQAAATTSAIAAAVSGGADYLGGDGLTFTDAKITELVATGKPVIPYTIDRRADKDRLLALGVAGFLSDQPHYLKRTTAIRARDSWTQGVLGHGFLVNATSPDMTKVTVSSGAVTLAQQTVLNAIPGEVCPLTNAAGSYTIDLDIGFATMPASGGSCIVLFGMPDDKNRSLVNAAAFPSGYLLLIRAVGGMSLYKLTDGSSTATQIGSTVATAALTAGTFAHIRITVTPTTVTAARTDGSTLTIGPVADTTHRGGYVALGKKDVVDGTVSFKNLVIT